MAYMVCAALGIDSAGYSLPYVALWSGGDLAKVTATANRVIACARNVLTAVEQVRQLAHDRAPTRPRALESDLPNQREPVTARLMEVVEAAACFYQRQLEAEAGRQARAS